MVGYALDQAGVFCDLRDGRHVVADLDYADGPFAVRGGFGAGVGRDCGDGLEGCDVDVVVVDLRTGRTRTRVLSQDAPGCVGSGGDCGAPVRALVVGAYGTAAWVTCPRQGGQGGCAPGERQVWRVDATGRRLPVAAGSGIAVRSLRASPDGLTFTWTQDGVPRTAGF